MIVEDNQDWFIVKNVFDDSIIGPFEDREDAENWLRSNNQEETLQNEIAD